MRIPLAYRHHGLYLRHHCLEHQLACRNDKSSFNRASCFLWAWSILGRVRAFDSALEFPFHISFRNDRIFY